MHSEYIRAKAFTTLYELLHGDAEDSFIRHCKEWSGKSYDLESSQVHDLVISKKSIRKCFIEEYRILLDLMEKYSIRADEETKLAILRYALYHYPVELFNVDYEGKTFERVEQPTTQLVNNRNVDIHHKGFTGFCNFFVEVGTNGFCGGDSGHGSRTYLKITGSDGADMKASASEGKWNESTVEIQLGGDDELDHLLDALQYASYMLHNQIDEKREEDRMIIEAEATANKEKKAKEGVKDGRGKQ